MIEKISKHITYNLQKRNIIQPDIFEVYRYGIEVVLSTIIGIILVLLCGIVFNMFWLTVLYYVIFFVIRQFSGGYHADTYLGCKIVLVGSTISILGITKFLTLQESYSLILHVLLLIFSVSILIQLSPMDNENKPLNEKQEQRFKHIVVILSIAFSIISFPVYFQSIESACIIALTLALIAFMQTVEYTRRGGDKYEQK